MIRRLVDAHYDEFSREATDDRVRFWLRESRTPEVLIAVATGYPEVLNELLPVRPLLAEALDAGRTDLQQELDREQASEKRADEEYWRPIKRELEIMGREKRKNGPLSE